MALLNIRSAAKVKFTSTGKMRVVSPGYGYGGGGGGGGLSSGLQAFYRLSDTSDSSGNGNTLTNNGGVTFSSGKIGNAANLQGNQTLTAQIASITSGSPGSYSCWINRNGIEEVPLCVVKAFGTSVYADSHIGGRLAFYLPSTGNEPSQSLASNVWVHVVLSHDSTIGVKLYVNGQLFHTENTANAFQDSAFTLGAGDGQNGKGLVDAVGIWNRALTLGEVSSLYNSGAGIEL